MKDVTKYFYTDELIESMLDIETPRTPHILYNKRRNDGRKLLKSVRMFEMESLDEISDKYQALNGKVKIGLIEWAETLWNKRVDDANLRDIRIYNQLTKPEKHSYMKNVVLFYITDVYADIDPSGFTKRELFEVCELHLMPQAEKCAESKYFPANFIYRDEIKGSDDSNARNTALLERMLESDYPIKCNVTLQAMDEDYEIEQKGLKLLRGKRLKVIDIQAHDEEGYVLPACVPMLVDILK